MFTWFGADLRGEAGQMPLIGILLAALVIGAFTFKPGRAGTRRP